MQYRLGMAAGPTPTASSDPSSDPGEWFADPLFWSLFEAWMFPPESFAQAEEESEQIQQLTGIEAGAALDLCCGPGRHAIPLAKAGFRVTGIDLQSHLLERARDYAQREEVVVELVHADVRELARPDSFHLVINMFSSFGYFTDPADDLRLLTKAYAALHDGGALVLDLRSKEVHAMDYEETHSQEMPGGDLIVQRTETTDDWTRTLTTWTHVHGSVAHSFQVTYNLYSGIELRSLLEEAGFRDVQLYGNLDGAAYDHRAERLVAVAWR